MPVLRLLVLLLALVALAACAATKDARVGGRGKVFLATDATGRVVQAKMVESISPHVDRAVVTFALQRWRGPANAQKVIALTYYLNDGPEGGGKVLPTDPAYRIDR